MIPIVSISNFFTFVIAIFITLYLWRAYQKSKENLLKYFLYFFISITFLFFSIATPFFIFNDINLISISLSTTVAFLYLTLAFISIVSLRIIKYQKLEKVYLIVLLLSFIFSFSMMFINFESVKIGYSKNIIYWYVPSSRIFWQIGSVVNGIISGITLLSVTIFFFIGGLKNKDKFIQKRAFLMGAGMFFLTLTGVINFIIAKIPKLSFHIISSLLAAFGLLMLFAGIVMVKPIHRTHNMKHIT